MYFVLIDGRASIRTFQIELAFNLKARVFFILSFLLTFKIIVERLTLKVNIKFIFACK